MTKDLRLNISAVFSILVFSILIGLTTAYSVENSAVAEKTQNTSDEAAELTQANGETKEMKRNQSSPPTFTNVKFSSPEGEIFVNPRYTGEVISARYTFTGNQIGEKLEAALQELRYGWWKVSVPEPNRSGITGIMIAGKEGNIRISSEGKSLSGTGELDPLSPLVIAFDKLEATFLIPKTQISNPESYGIGIYDFEKEGFISGEIIALKSGEVAAKFENISSSVVNKDGNVRVSLKKPDKSFLNSEPEAWGYKVLTPEAQTGKEASVKAEVFGLPEKAKVKFTFYPLQGQQIEPHTNTLSVKEINSGESLATIETKIAGGQPLSVKVERVD